MNLLFIDTHSEKVVIKIKKKDEIFEEEVLSNRSHSEVLVPTLDSVLKRSGLKLQDIDEIIVVNGPGSFTGVRMGVTIAKTIAYCLNKKIKTITSLEMFGVSSEEEFDLVTVSDSKGVYSALKKGNEYTQFLYHRISEFEIYKNENNYKVLKEKKIDLEKILLYLENVEPINPHLVNPIYIKEIDALK